MKEFESPVKITADVELIAEMQKEYTLKQQMKIKRGLILFVIFPYEDWKVEQAVIKSDVSIDFNNTKRVIKTHKTHQFDKGFYIWAMNAQTAVKKLQKQFANLEKGIKVKKSEPLKLKDHFFF